jgi:hypothetical protein
MKSPRKYSSTKMASMKASVNWKERRNHCPCLRCLYYTFSRQTAESFSFSQGNEVLPSLRATLFYLEEVSESRNDSSLAEQHKTGIETLKNTIEKIDGRLQGLCPLISLEASSDVKSEIEKELALLREEVRSVFDMPDLQKHPVSTIALLHLTTCRIS